MAYQVLVNKSSLTPCGKYATSVDVTIDCCCCSISVREITLTIPRTTYVSMASVSVNSSALLFLSFSAPVLYQDNNARDKSTNVAIQTPLLINITGYRRIV